MNTRTQPNSIRVDSIKNNALQIYEAVISRDIAAACLMDSLQSAIEYGIPAKQAHKIVIDAWKEEGRQRIRNWDIRCLGSLIDLFPDCVPSRFRNRAFTVDADHVDAQWRVQFLMNQARLPDAGVTAPNFDSYLKSSGMASNKGLQGRIYLKVQSVVAEIRALKAAEPPPLPSFEGTTASTKENLLATWVDTEPTKDVIADLRGPFWSTAVVDGTILYTRPCRVMERASTGWSLEPFTETDGVLFQFVRDGQRINNWRPVPQTAGAERGQVMQSSFDYFAKKYAVHISPLGWARLERQIGDSDEDRCNQCDRPRP